MQLRWKAAKSVRPHPIMAKPGTGVKTNIPTWYGLPYVGYAFEFWRLICEFSAALSSV